MHSGTIVIPHSVDYALEVPSTPGPWPLLVGLHGYGQSAGEFVGLLGPLADRGILVAAPQAPHHFYVSLKRRKVGFTWLTRYERDRSANDLVRYLELFHQRLRDDFDVLPEQVFLLGFSQGVSIAYRTWLYSRLPVRGLFACAGDLPPDVEVKLEEGKRIPIRLVHGSLDSLVPVDKAEKARQALGAKSFDVELREFDCGHSLTGEMIRYVGDEMAAMIGDELEKGDASVS